MNHHQREYQNISKPLIFWYLFNNNIKKKKKKKKKKKEKRKGPRVIIRSIEFYRLVNKTITHLLIPIVITFLLTQA